MKLNNLWLVLNFLVLTSPCLAQINNNFMAVVTQEQTNCENWNKADWDDYLNNTLLKFPYADQIYSRLKSVTEKCKNSFDSNNINMCTNRIFDYYKQFVGGGKGMYSATMTDEKYLASIPPEAAELPDELKNLKNGLPKNWREITSKNGWKYALFQSNTGNSSRLVIYIPGEKFDKLLVYYSFAANNPDPTTYDGVQLQAIGKVSNESTAPKYYFNSFGFQGHDGTPKSQLFGGRCISCHTSGPRAIVPQKEASLKTEVGGVKNLEEFNDLIVQKTPPDLSPYYDLNNFPKNVKVGADCKSCHNGVDRSSLAISVNRNGSFYTGEFHRKVLVEKTMPEWSDGTISAAARSKMVSDISVDYKAELKKWLTEVTCEGNQKAKNSEKPSKTKSAPSTLSSGVIK